MEIARALRSGRGEVGRHVPTDQVGGLAGADQEQADDEERERPDLARGRRQPRTDDGGGVGHDQSGATTPAAHVLRQGHGDQRRAGGEHRRAQPGQRLAAEEVQARSDETATTDAIAAFPEACMATRVPIVRRWTAARCPSSR